MVITPLRQTFLICFLVWFLFSLLKKYFVFFSPYLSHLPLERTINPSALSSKTFATQVCTCSESFQILHKGSVEILLVHFAVSSADSPLSLSLLIWVNSFAYCTEKKTDTMFNPIPSNPYIWELFSFIFPYLQICLHLLNKIIWSLNLYIFDKVTKKVRDDRKKLRDWHINEIWSRGVYFSYIPWNVPARILLKLKIHQNWDLSSCQMSEHVVSFLFYLFIYLFFTFTWLFSRYTVV